jgi:hypothetical protein
MLKQYFGFVFGVMFGSVIASITTFYIVSITYGDTPVVQALDIQDCLMEKIEEMA